MPKKNPFDSFLLTKIKNNSLFADGLLVLHAIRTSNIHPVDYTGISNAFENNTTVRQLLISPSHMQDCIKRKDLFNLYLNAFFNKRVAYDRIILRDIDNEHEAATILKILSRHFNKFSVLELGSMAEPALCHFLLNIPPDKIKKVELNLITKISLLEEIQNACKHLIRSRVSVKLFEYYKNLDPHFAKGLDDKNPHKPDIKQKAHRSKRKSYACPGNETDHSDKKNKTDTTSLSLTTPSTTTYIISKLSPAQTVTPTPLLPNNDQHLIELQRQSLQQMIIDKNNAIELYYQAINQLFEEKEQLLQQSAIIVALQPQSPQLMIETQQIYTQLNTKSQLIEWNQQCIRQLSEATRNLQAQLYQADQSTQSALFFNQHSKEIASNVQLWMPNTQDQAQQSSSAPVFSQSSMNLPLSS